MSYFGDDPCSLSPTPSIICLNTHAMRMFTPDDSGVWLHVPTFITLCITKLSYFTLTTLLVFITFCGGSYYIPQQCYVLRRKPRSVFISCKSSSIWLKQCTKYLYLDIVFFPSSEVSSSVASSETQGQLVGAGKSLNGREKNSDEEKSRTQRRGSPSPSWLLLARFFFLPV